MSWAELVHSHGGISSTVSFFFLREVVKTELVVLTLVKTTTLEQDPPKHKIVGGVCLHDPCLMSKDGVFIA